MSASKPSRWKKFALIYAASAVVISMIAVKCTGGSDRTSTATTSSTTSTTQIPESPLTEVTRTSAEPTGPSKYYPDEYEVQVRVPNVCMDALKRELKDPDSAEFDEDGWNFKELSKTDKVPIRSYDPEVDVAYLANGRVNGKNSFGAYTGYQKFYCYAYFSPDTHIHGIAHLFD